MSTREYRRLEARVVAAFEAHAMHRSGWFVAADGIHHCRDCCRDGMPNILDLLDPERTAVPVYPAPWGWDRFLDWLLLSRWGAACWLAIGAAAVFGLTELIGKGWR